MNADYMLACGIVWRETADPEAGWELVEALQSADPRERVLAQALLVESGEHSMPLLESALSAGEVRPEAVAACMVEILRARQLGRAGGQPPSQPVVDVWLC